MESSKLMKPLFHGNFFNRDGRRMRAVYVKSVSDGADEYRLWRGAGKPDRDYASAENDKYYLYVEINAYPKDSSGWAEAHPLLSFQLHLILAL